ncbi:two-component system chemotaxis sensor kinase CheA [Ciceribacter lividus]|uniref:Chemotaxis protein CheA n=1 Tax=Ciceribacter lividus TaxID=1197950 RepID=A0A6I7HHW5_9HYPH|nr:chemotaxis protein CheA [Ciceribacter lividus]RCW21040.1 two-component system chemotaxis sensor kinase CheA [Ciceribacter lividus]
MLSNDPVETFRQEARDLLEQLEQSLLDLGQSPKDTDLVNSAFRALHTLKGSGAMFGFTEVAGFVHAFETAFDRVRKGETAITAPLIAVALAAKDHVSELIAEPGQHAAKGSPILARLEEIVSNVPAANRNAAQTALMETEPSASSSLRLWHIRFRLPEDALALGANPLLLIDELRGLGECVVTANADAVPPVEVIDPEVCYLAWDVKLTTAAPRDAIDDVFIFLKDGMDLSIEALGADMEKASDKEEAAPASDATTAPPTTAAKEVVAPAAARLARTTEARETASSSLRVPAERLDELMDRVGELVIAQARLSQLADASNDVNLKTIAEELERLSSGLRDTTMGIRMVPIGTLFGRFRRLVHDLSRDLGKEVEFLTTGEETELDKTMIERLADPLVHIIRNAVDHGLERPDRRSASGKPAVGRVRLAASHTGAEVAISITDDGAGLNAERIRAKAEEAGLLAPDAKLPEQDLFRFIFHPGFSTAREITSVSGRGVGMDVVKRTIDMLRGSIDVASKPGEGTTVTLRLPLTLAIIEGMLVRVGNGRYCIPLSAVEECVELPITAETVGKGRSLLNIRGSLVPFLRLRELFRTEAPPDLHQKVVIVAVGEQRVGLVVDQILGNNQTVIKSLSKLHADVETFSGATILGDGTVALILDVTHLVRFGQSFENRLRAAQAGRAA